VCNDNLEALIIEGAPPKEALQLAKFDLLAEFAELSGSSRNFIKSRKKILLFSSQIQVMQLSRILIEHGNYELLGYLNKIGVKGSIKNETDKIRYLKKLDGQIKGKMIHLNNELKEYDKKEEGETPVFSFFNDQLAILSNHFKFNINMNITLAQYASYLKLYNNTNLRNHGRIQK